MSTARDQSYWARRISRRKLVRGAALGGAGLAGVALIGCGGDDDVTPAPGTTPRTTPAPGTTPTPTPAVAEPERTRGGVMRGVFLGNGHGDSVDVHRNFADPVSWISNFVLNKVVRYSNPDTGELEGDLAETFETPDAQVYTFKIRPDVKWQDTPLTRGRQLTAEDIKWHWERQQGTTLLDGSTANFRHASFYRQITKIDTPDDLTVVATLTEPNGTFLDRLASYFSMVPNREATERFEADHRTITEEAMPATGAYTLKQWRVERDWTLERNPAYFKKDEVLLDGWIYPYGLFADPAAHRIAFEQKQVDHFGSPDPSLTKAIIEANKGNMWESLSGVANTVFLHLNMNHQFKDIRHAQAVNLAFDRRAIFQAFHQGLGQVSGPVPWLQEGYALRPEELVQLDGYRPNRDEDTQKARQLWDAANGAALGQIDIKTEASWQGVWPDTPQVMPDMLNQALGVRQFISTRATYDEDIIPNLANGNFPNWFAWTSAVTGPDPRAGLFNTFHSEGQGNFQKVNNPDLDRLLGRAMLTADYEEGVDLVRQAQRIMLDKGQYGNVVLYNYISRGAGWNYFHGNSKVAPTDAEPGQGYNISAGHLAPEKVWIDPNDPSYQGRTRVTL
jgi:ABC-type transport system substrate-binding protein